MATEIAPSNLSGATTHTNEYASGDGDDVALRIETQQLMENHVGIVRDHQRLQQAVTRLQQIRLELPPPTNRRRAEARNIVESGLAITCSALARMESRGSHYRSDFSAKDDARFRKHSVMTGGSVRFE
jgi:L-aspartate oxidase